MKPRRLTIGTLPYVRVLADGTIRHVFAADLSLDLSPAMARMFGQALIRAADRADPERTALPPWRSAGDAA